MIKGKVIKMEDGCFNDIITVKLEDGRKVESRGFDMGLKGVPVFKIGQTVIVTLVWNDLSKCYFARKLEVL